jgi:hypothetical protein
VSRTAEIFFAVVCLLFVGGELLIASANGLTAGEIIFTAILAVCVFGLLAIVDGVQLGSRSRVRHRRKRSGGGAGLWRRRRDPQVVTEAPGDKARVSHHPDQLAL